MHTVYLLLAFATNILAFEDDFEDIDQGFPLLLNMTDNMCSRSEECIPQELCPYFQEDVTRLEQLPEESKEYKEQAMKIALMEEQLKALKLRWRRPRVCHLRRPRQHQ